MMSCGDLNSSILVCSQPASVDKQGVVSFLAEIPIPLQRAMTGFIEKHPNWDQYRVLQAALAGFLVQNGLDSRPITRLYIRNMLGLRSFIERY